MFFFWGGFIGILLGFIDFFCVFIGILLGFHWGFMCLLFGLNTFGLACKTFEVLFLLG